MDPQNMGGEEVNDDDDGELTTDEGNTNIRISTVRYTHALGRLGVFFSFFFFANRCAQLQLPGSEEGSASFEILGEDHTLGNALRYIIMKKYVGLPPSLPAPFVSLIYIYIQKIQLAKSTGTKAPRSSFAGTPYPIPPKPR